VCDKQIIVVKLTGEMLKNRSQCAVDDRYIRELARQIKALQPSHYFGIVVGGGNFFRGAREGAALGMSPAASDQVGIISTVLNGLILQDIFTQEGLDTILFSAIDCPSAGAAISPQALQAALQSKDCIIFAGGLGSPFFTTDTTAVVRALQIGAHEVWKATKVDGIYTRDPQQDPTAVRIDRLSYTQAINDRLRVMDETAFSLAREHKLIIRVFSFFTPQALMRAAHEATFGSTVVPEIK
jgi:uridylate kinase